MEGPGSIGDESQDRLGSGTRLGKYEIVRLLGAGGMGAVYEAVHTEIGKRVAVKVLSPAIASGPGARARFLREAQLTSRVRHPNIVDVTDMGSEGGQTYLVMELLRGEDLAQRLSRTGPLPPQQLVDIMLPVCSAVVEAHHAGVTHRDLKPQNIFLAVGPHTTQPKVLDFGISKGNEPGAVGPLTGTGTMIGTPFYLAPEQIMDARAAGPSSDQYALGVIMYECLTGHRPFEAESVFVVFQEIVASKPVPIHERRVGIPAALEMIVMRAMSPAPSDRFASTSGLGRALLPFSSTRVRSIWEDTFSEGPGGFAPSIPVPFDSGSLLAPGTSPQSPHESPTTFDRPETPSGPAPGPAPGPTTGPTGIGPLPVSERGTWQPGTSPGARVSRRRKMIVFVGIVALVGLGIGVGLQRLRPRPETKPGPGVAIHSLGVGAVGIVDSIPPVKVRDIVEKATSRTFRVTVTVEPDRASIELDGRPVGHGHFEGVLPVDQVPNRLRVAADGYDEQSFEITDQTPPPPTIVLVPSRRGTVARGASMHEDPPGEPTPRPSYRPVRRPRPVPPVSPLRALNPNGAPVIE